MPTSVWTAIASTKRRLVETSRASGSAIGGPCTADRHAASAAAPLARLRHRERGERHRRSERDPPQITAAVRRAGVEASPRGRPKYCSANASGS